MTTPRDAGLAELVRLVEDAAERFTALAQMLEHYPRMHNDPNGRTILDVMEIAKASAREFNRIAVIHRVTAIDARSLLRDSRHTDAGSTKRLTDDESTV